jgi:hypothetical protein
MIGVVSTILFNDYTGSLQIMMVQLKIFDFTMSAKAKQIP